MAAATRKLAPAFRAGVLGILLATPCQVWAQAVRTGSPPEIPARVESNPERQLTSLSRTLRKDTSGAAYTRLGDFARRHASSAVGARAALALAHYDFTKSRYEQAQQWLARAQREQLLREYVLHWRAQVEHALGLDDEALAQLETLRREFPDSVMTEQTLELLGESSLAVGRPERAITALERYEKTPSRPALLLLRARAREQAGQAAAAAADYVALHYRFPLSDEARSAGDKLVELRASLGERFPEVPLAEQVARAELLYDARRWREALAEYQGLVAQLPAQRGAEVERAQLRIAGCRVQLGAEPGVLAAVLLADPELDAERLYLLSQAFRSQKQKDEMLAGIEQLSARHPRSRWAEEGLFAAGNYFWVELDRPRAASFYRRVFENFPTGSRALVAHWRVAWVAFIERRAEASELLEQHLRRFGGSPYTADAIYWLGRAAEQAGSAAHARSYYLKLRQRFPHTYFGGRAAERLRELGTAPVNAAEVLALVPLAPPLPRTDEPIPSAAAARWARAQALRTIAFDASAELELRAAYQATSSLRLLFEAARAAVDAERYSVGITLMRQVLPQPEARRIEQAPLAAWRTAFPLPFEQSLRTAARRHGLDPMLVAGLIRQESAFQTDAVSRAGAVGLMQVLPRTGQKLARRLRLRYGRERLFDPEYNLKLGTLYLSDLLKESRSVEAALAAFNAGEERVAAWESERPYEDRAAFVESIPFTETREYVQFVLRNAEIYRALYGKRP